MSDLTIALAGGAIGSALTAVIGQASVARSAWSEIELNDEEVRERSAQLVAWVDDRTRSLLVTMATLTNDFAARGLIYSGAHGGALAEAKAAALHEYRDEQWRVRIAVAQLRAREGVWHRAWRALRRCPAQTLTALTEVEPFLDRWREPVTRHESGTGNGVPVLDRTERTTDDAIAELPGLNLT